MKSFALLLQAIGRSKAPLYILGDLFDQFWIGTDDHTGINDTLSTMLAEFSRQSGGQLYILRGNRDFYLNRAFARQTGSTLLQEPFLLPLGTTQNALLLHGDILCTRDIAYQHYRRLITMPWVERLFMALPLMARRGIAHRTREIFRARSNRKPRSILDVDPETVCRQMKHYETTILIHGHTHRPGIHDFQLCGQPAKRIVLGDWYEQDSVLVWQEGTGRLLSVDACLASL